MSTSINPERCPLCGGSNECQVARGRGTCWCFTRPIPESVLEKVPDEARDLACVCSACAFGEREPTVAYLRMREILRGRG